MKPHCIVSAKEQRVIISLQGHEMIDEHCDGQFPAGCSCEGIYCGVEGYYYTREQYNTCSYTYERDMFDDKCLNNCFECSKHEECFSGCCDASEKVCKQFCHDEFGNPFFINSDSHMPQVTEECEAYLEL